VTDVASAMRRVVDGFSGAGVSLDEHDGVRLAHWDAEPRWWLSVRPSGTEPLLRLNVEAAERDVMEQVRDRALAVIRES